MLRLYTCYKCCFPFKADDDNIPPRCPACNCTPEWFLSEPYNEQEKRRIHVDPPEPDKTGRDPLDISYHVAKKFPSRSRNGRLRRFVFQYHDAATAKQNYENLFDWDIVPSEGTDEKSPLLYCATGPGNPNWEPRVPSFIYGYFKDEKTDETGKEPFFMVEVSNIEETLQKVEKYGGKILKRRYTECGNDYAIVEDSDGNALYLWETPSTVTWDEPESQGG